MILLSSFKIKPSFALPLVQAAAEAIAKSPLSEEDKKNALAQVKKQAEEESKAAEEEEGEEKERKPKVQVRIDEIFRDKIRLTYFITDTDKKLTNLKIRFIDKKTKEEQLFDKQPFIADRAYTGEWNVQLNETRGHVFEEGFEIKIETAPDSETKKIEGEFENEF